MYDLLIKSGEVIDPAQGIHSQRDIGISQGKIADLALDIEPRDAKKVIHAKGDIVVPGLIDIHAHVADGIIDIGTAPDKVGVLSGVTTVYDGGSTGYTNFLDLKRLVIPQAQTDVFCFLHMSPTGLAKMPEVWDWHNIDLEAMLKTIEENRDIIKGIKLRAIGTVAQNLGIEAVRVAKRIATEARIPLMVHIGRDMREKTQNDRMNAFTRELLPFMDKGDILTHIFTPKAGSVIKFDGSVLPELREAIGRGVALDVANGITNLSFEIAMKGLGQGILPTTISTDATSDNFNSRAVLSLPVIMSKFLALGLSLDQVIEMTTINPARVVGEEQKRGSLRVGMPADVSILEMTEGDFLFFDRAEEGTSLKGKLLLIPKLTLKSGVEVVTHSRFK